MAVIYAIAGPDIIAFTSSGVTKSRPSNAAWSGSR